MNDTSNPETQGATLWRRRIRNLQTGNLVLAAVLVIAGVNAGRIALARLASSDRKPAAAESLAGAPVKTGAPSQNSVSTADAATGEQAADGAAAKDGQLLKVASRIAAGYRDSAASRLDDVGDRLADVAQWSRSIVPDPDALPAAAPPEPGETPTASPAVDAPRESVQDVSQSDAVVLLNPVRSGGKVQFLVDGEVVSLRPGESRTFAPAGVRLVQFDRGKNFGVAELAITAAGVYAFRVTDSGWDLNRLSSPDTL